MKEKVVKCVLLGTVALLLIYSLDKGPPQVVNFATSEDKELGLQYNLNRTGLGAEESESLNASEEYIEEDFDPDPGAKITILIWNSFWQWTHFGMGTSNRGFKSIGCQYQNCYITTDRSKMRNPNVRVDGVLVHAFDEDLANLAKAKALWPMANHFNMATMPSYIYFNAEPFNDGMDQRFMQFPDYANMFNITYSFLEDSVVLRPYGRVVPKDFEGLQTYPRPKWEQPPKKLLPQLLKKDMSQKTRDILWMVSHCDTESKREDFVDKLQKATSLKIDIYGKCGNLKLPGQTESGMIDTVNKREQMYADNTRNYKFYLSLENSLCKDYVTEKFFSALRAQNVIPVVYGGKSKDLYQHLAPPGSYINIEDFKSVADLAARLEYLAKNDTAFKEYFWWTEKYKVISLAESYKNAQCSLCKKLNQVHAGKLKLPPIDLRRWWNSKDSCRNPPVFQ